jgi:hypothetical protein
MSKEDHDWLKRQVDLYDMIMPGMVKPPKPGTPEHYKWIHIECKKLARRKDGSRIYRCLSEKQL